MKIAVMGDTLCRMRDGGDPFEYVRPLWAAADVRLLNLETVLTRRGTPAPKATRLRTDPLEVAWLDSVDVVHLANNHALDFGAQGVTDTLRWLRRQGVRGAGVGQGQCAWAPVFAGGVGVLAFHVYELHAPPYELAHLEDWNRARACVERLAAQVEMLVVSLHWGAEHAPHPSPGQVGQARTLIDAGATLVVGHGPHRLQAIERHHDGLIAYSLGNFNYRQVDVRERWHNRVSGLLQVEVEGARVVDWELVPCIIDDQARPVPWPAYLETLSEPDLSWERWYEEIGARYMVDSLRSLLSTIPRYGWGRVRKLAWWLRQRHTWRAVGGALREALRCE